MRDDFGCHICGKCWWTDCENDADYTHDVHLKDRVTRATLFDGKIELCAGHTRYVQSTQGRYGMNINPLAIGQANALKESRERV